MGVFQRREKMKGFNFNWKLNLILGLLIVLLVMGNVSYAGTGKVEVKVIVPSMQRMVINEPVAVSFSYPWKGMESGEALIFRNVGNINVQSNVDWLLNISSLEIYRELEVYLRPAGKLNAQWQRVDGSSALFSGGNGSENISWNIKIVPARNNYISGNRGTIADRESLREMRTVNLIFTLTQL